MSRVADTRIPVSLFQTLTLPSLPALAKSFPSGLKASARILSSWPLRVRTSLWVLRLKILIFGKKGGRHSGDSGSDWNWYEASIVLKLGTNFSATAISGSVGLATI